MANLDTDVDSLLKEACEKASASQPHVQKSLSAVVLASGGQGHFENYTIFEKCGTATQGSQLTFVAPLELSCRAR